MSPLHWRSCSFTHCPLLLWDQTLQTPLPTAPLSDSWPKALPGLAVLVGSSKAEGIPEDENMEKGTAAREPQNTTKVWSNMRIEENHEPLLLPGSPQGVQEPWSIQELPNTSNKAGDCGSKTKQPWDREEERNMRNKTKAFI